MRNKRQYTKTVFLVKKAKDTGMMVRVIKNKSEGRPFDVIKFSIFTDEENENIHFDASPEEAIEIAWGLNKAVWHFLNGFEPYQKFRMKGGKTKYGKKDIWWSL